MFPSKYPAGDWTPANSHLRGLLVRIDRRPSPPRWYCRHDHPRAVLLMTHGNAGNLAARPVAEALARSVRLVGHDLRLSRFRPQRRHPVVDGVSATLVRPGAIRRSARGLRKRMSCSSANRLAGQWPWTLRLKTGGGGWPSNALSRRFATLPEATMGNSSHRPSPATSSTVKVLESTTGRCCNATAITIGFVPTTLVANCSMPPMSPRRSCSMNGNGHNDDRTEEYYSALETFLTKLAAK